MPTGDETTDFRNGREVQVFTFGEYIRKLRKDRHFTLKEAAVRMGMPSQKLCDIESGRRYHKRVSVELVHKASIAYGVPIAEIFNSVQTTLHVSQTTEDVLAELIPLVRLTALVSEQLKIMSSTYPQELEDLATEVFNNVCKIQILSKLILKRNVQTSSITEV